MTVTVTVTVQVLTASSRPSRSPFFPKLAAHFTLRSYSHHMVPYLTELKNLHRTHGSQPRPAQGAAYRCSNRCRTNHRCDDTNRNASKVRA